MPFSKVPGDMLGIKEFPFDDFWEPGLDMDNEVPTESWQAKQEAEYHYQSQAGLQERYPEYLDVDNPTVEHSNWLVITHPTALMCAALAAVNAGLFWDVEDQKICISRTFLWYSSLAHYKEFRRFYPVWPEDVRKALEDLPGELALARLKSLGPACE